MPEPITHTFDLPVPPSVNRTRRVDWQSMSLRKQWTATADALVLAQAQGRPQMIDGQFEAIITLRDGATRMTWIIAQRKLSTTRAALSWWPMTGQSTCGDLWCSGGMRRKVVGWSCGKSKPPVSFQLNQQGRAQLLVPFWHR
jgi:hypothetical protein